jgi:ribonuclease PH
MSSLTNTPAAPRADGRAPHQLRPIRFVNHIAPYATGSTLIEWGNTRVICGITVDESVPRWMKEQNVTGGWITAEYSMLPYSTLTRKQRDISKGKIDGRSQEIQRLIGRAMRSAVDLEKIGPRTIWVDCDVLQADGGTRTAAITGAMVALGLAVKKLQSLGKLPADPSFTPLANAVAAVSVGIIAGQPLLDLCYTEDVAATVDMNIVMTAKGEFIELQGTGEEATFSDTELTSMLSLARSGIKELLAMQQTAINAG